MRLLLLIFILWCQCATAQFGGVQQPMFSMLSSESGVFDPTNIPGLAYYWTIRDSPTNNVSVSNWIDRIQAAAMTNGALSKQPMGTSTGLFFGPSAWNAPLYLSNSSGPLSLTNFEQTWITTFKIRKFESAIPMQVLNFNSGAAYPIELWSDADAGANNAGATWSHFVNPATFPASGVNGKLPTNEWVQCTIIGSNNTAMYYYTNGVFAATTTPRALGFQWLCSNNNETRNFDGWVSELLIYTNILTPTQLSNVFYHAYKP